MRNCRIEKFGKILNLQEFRNSEIDNSVLNMPTTETTH